MNSSQPISFFPTLSPLHIYVQPNLDLDQAWRTIVLSLLGQEDPICAVEERAFVTFWFVFGIRHDLAYFKINHSNL